MREEVKEIDKLTLPTSKINGVLFKEAPSIKTGKESCIVPLTRRSPLYFVEQATKKYDFDFDFYGLHLGQEDHLIFLGNSKQEINLKLVDMRENSDTLFTEEEIVFYPSPNLELVIPCGVAHALINMANIITVNRPVLYFDDKNEYLLGYDVIDWPIENKDYLSYKTNKIEASDNFYQQIVSKQHEIVKSPPTHNTPKSIIVFDEKNGKVLLKEKA